MKSAKINWKYSNGSIKRLTKAQESLLHEEERTEYIKQLRSQDEKSNLCTMSLKSKKKWHSFLHILMRLNRMAVGIKVCKLNTSIPKFDRARPIIFVLTHVGKDDIIIFNEVVKEHFTILSGDYESLHNNLEGLISVLNGTIFFDMKSKEERNQIEERVVKVLNQGDNILCSMEAAWNLSPNELVLELFPGMLRAAIKANAVIIPVGIERISNKLYGINVATQVFDMTDYLHMESDNKEMLNRAREDLRQIMAELKFATYYHKYILEKISVTRQSIGDYSEYKKAFQKDILKGWTFTEEIVNSKKYHNNQKPEYAFSFLFQKYNLQPSHEWSRNKYCELLQDIKNPIYPYEVRERLIEISTQFRKEKGSF